MLPELWFWLGNEWRELVNLWRLWDIVLVVWLVFWFLLIVSLLKKSSVNNPFAYVIIWSAFAIAWLYVAWMIPFHQIMPNFTADDFYRWWVIHLWVELTFELFVVWVIAFFTFALGLVSQRSAVRLMLFELIEALDYQNDIQCKYTGWTVLRLYMWERLSNSESCKNFVKNVIENYSLPYITITPTFSICPKHWYIAWEHDYYPKCDEEIWYKWEEFDFETRKIYTYDAEKLEKVRTKMI